MRKYQFPEHSMIVKSADFVELINRNKQIESELAHYKQEAEKIPLVCAKTMGEYCDEDGDCPEICPRLRGGERVL